METALAPATRPRILVVDDDPEILDLLRRGLAIEGFEVQAVASGEKAVAAVASRPPDAVVLDVMMPGMDGFGVLRALRGGSSVPILFLTARDRVRDRIEGLDAGADDYLAKPFAFGELVARLRALIRRGKPAEREVLTIDDVRLDLASRDVRRGERVLELTQTEFELLRAFMERPNLVLSREAVLELVWGYQPAGVSNVVDVYIGHLRRKLEEGGASRPLHTVRGVGYILRKADA
ncbi:MAG: response regulator transcription factor [Actinobacteria bacterium]|nr:response regulator transcription factor [Actinomycetota bacterium]